MHRHTQKIKSTEETSGQSKRGEDDGDNCKPLHDDVHLVALDRVSEVVWGGIAGSNAMSAPVLSWQD